MLGYVGIYQEDGSITSEGVFVISGGLCRRWLGQSHLFFKRAIISLSSSTVCLPVQHILNKKWNNMGYLKKTWDILTMCVPMVLCMQVQTQFRRREHIHHIFVLLGEEASLDGLRH